MQEPLTRWIGRQKRRPHKQRRTSGLRQTAASCVHRHLPSPEAPRGWLSGCDEPALGPRAGAGAASPRHGAACSPGAPPSAIPTAERDGNTVPTRLLNKHAKAGPMGLARPSDGIDEPEDPLPPGRGHAVSSGRVSLCSLVLRVSVTSLPSPALGSDGSNWSLKKTLGLLPYL